MKDRILLTPGPLTTSSETKAAMLSDFGSWDGAFNALTASVCSDLLAIVDGQSDHVCVPLQGSGTFAVEAALGTLVPRGGKVLVPDNGAYCKRIVRILGCLGRQAVVLPHGEREPADPARIEAALAADPGLTHVAQVHCETGTGILNPLPEIAAAVARHGRGLIVDAMSSYGAIPIDARCSIQALVAALAGKNVSRASPASGFVIARARRLGSPPPETPFVSRSGPARPVAVAIPGEDRQWRFTPPTHVMAALRAALDRSIRRREGSRPGSRDIGTIAPSWSRACVSSASGPSCPTPCRRRSSSRSTPRSIRRTSSRSSMPESETADSSCIRGN